MRRFLFVICCLALSCLLGCTRVSKDPNTLYIWHWMTDRHDALQSLAKKYEEETGIKVNVELYAPSDVYGQKIIAAAQARILPDIYGILDDKKSVVAKFIKSGLVANLNDAFLANNSQWEKSLFFKAIDPNRFEKNNRYGVVPGIYAVPIDLTNIQIFYNKTLLKKVGINRAPATLGDFLIATQALKRIGIEGLVSGWGELWMIECFASNYAFNIMGEEKVMATYRGDVPYTDPDWIKVFGVFKTLSDKKALADGIVTKINKYAEQDFALERAAFAFNGSWAVNVYGGMNPDLNYGVMLPPIVSKDHPMKIWGGAGSSFFVNGSLDDEKKEKAIAFLKWLTAKNQQVYLSTKAENLPSNREALASVPKGLSEFAAAMDDTTHPTIWTEEEDALVKEKFARGIQSIIIGEKSPEQVAEEVQQEKKRRMKKRISNIK